MMKRRRDKKKKECRATEEQRRAPQGLVCCAGVLASIDPGNWLQSVPERMNKKEQREQFKP